MPTIYTTCSRCGGPLPRRGGAIWDGRGQRWYCSERCSDQRGVLELRDAEDAALRQLRTLIDAAIAGRGDESALTEFDEVYTELVRIRDARAQG